PGRANYIVDSNGLLFTQPSVNLTYERPDWNIKPSLLADVLADKIPQVSVAFIFEFVVNADFRSVVGVCDARFELDEEFLFRLLRIRLVLRDALEQGGALLRRSLHERPPAHLV